MMALVNSEHLALPPRSPVRYWPSAMVASTAACSTKSFRVYTLTLIKALHMRPSRHAMLQGRAPPCAVMKTDFVLCGGACSTKLCMSGPHSTQCVEAGVARRAAHSDV